MLRIRFVQPASKRGIGLEQSNESNRMLFLCLLPVLARTPSRQIVRQIRGARGQKHFAERCVCGVFHGTSNPSTSASTHKDGITTLGTIDSEGWDSVCRRNVARGTWRGRGNRASASDALPASMQCGYMPAGSAFVGMGRISTQRCAKLSQDDGHQQRGLRGLVAGRV